jgi:hypothetical protein
MQKTEHAGNMQKKIQKLQKPEKYAETESAETAETRKICRKLKLKNMQQTRICRKCAENEYRNCKMQKNET